MADYTNVKLHTSELGSRLRLDDVAQEDSINPRTCLSVDYIYRYENDIIGYLLNGREFDDAWNQRPQAVETDEDGVYLLTSGYHTITALMNVVKRATDSPDEEVDGDEGERLEDEASEDADDASDKKTLGDIDVDFYITIQVKKVKKSIDYKDAARYHASFANLHGQTLGKGEKSKSAYNALSAMNLTRDENDEQYFPYIDDRTLGSLLGVSKGTIHNVRHKVIRERFGPPEGEEQTTTDDNSQSADDAASDVANMESAASDNANTDSNAETAETQESQDGETEVKFEGKTEESADARKTGTDDLNLNLGGGTSEESNDGMSEEERTELGNKAKDFMLRMSNNSAELKTFVDFRENLDFLLSKDHDMLSQAIASSGLQVQNVIDKYSKLATTKDAEYNDCLHNIFKLFDVMLGKIADEMETDD